MNKKEAIWVQETSPKHKYTYEIDKRNKEEPEWMTDNIFVARAIAEGYMRSLMIDEETFMAIIDLYEGNKKVLEMHFRAIKDVMEKALKDLEEKDNEN